MTIRTMYNDYLKNRGVALVPDGRSLEIEAEFSEPFSTDLPKTWRAKDDGSLRGFAVEIISRGPLDDDALSKELKRLLDLDFWKLYKPSNRTSIHVHVNIQHWTLDKLLKVVVLYFLNEAILMRFCGPQREGNLFCLRLRDADDNMNAFRCLWDHDWQYLYEAFDKYKYSSLNLGCIPRFGSIEFRGFRGSKDYGEISAWLAVLKELENAAYKYGSLDDIWEKFTRNKRLFVLDTFPAYGPRLLDLCRDDWLDLLDYNISSVFSLIEYTKRPKKQIGRPYVFPRSERELDLREVYE